MSQFATGLRQRTDERRAHLSATRPYLGSADLLAPATVLQPVRRLHDQPQWGSCVGETYSSCAEHVLGCDLSGVWTWRDAARRQGTLDNPDLGTDSEHAIESGIRRGFGPYVPGEETTPREQLTQIADQQNEQEADKHRLSPTVTHRTIVSGRVARIADALLRGWGVGFGAGVLPAFGALGINQIAGQECFGGNEGHEQRIVGYAAPDDDNWPADWRGCLFVLSSWRGHGGIILPCDVMRTDGVVLTRGMHLPQILIVRPEVLESYVWDADSIEIRFGV